MRRQRVHAARNARALSRALTAKFNLVAANAWLALTVELLGCGVSASVVLFALGERLLWPGAQQGNRLQKYEDAGFLGLSLSCAPQRSEGTGLARGHS